MESKDNGGRRDEKKSRRFVCFASLLCFLITDNCHLEIMPCELGCLLAFNAQARNLKRNNARVSKVSDRRWHSKISFAACQFCLTTEKF